MYRFAVLLLGVSLVAGLCSCQLFQKKKMTSDEAIDTASVSEVSPSEAPQPETENTAATVTPDAGVAVGTPTTHVVQKGDTLYSLARHYYNGNQSMWRKIYEANQDKIGPDPDKIKVGMELTIP